MLGPDVGPRMKQANKVTGIGIESRDIRTLATIAMRTSESEIVQSGFSLMLFGDYVIDLERERKGGLRDATVFAASLRPITHGPSQLTVHGRV
jgi:hypothetical protein